MSAKLTLEQWAQSTRAHKLLSENLKTNIEVYVNDFLEGEDPKEAQELKDAFLRMNLIMVRQFQEQLKSQQSSKTCPYCQKRGAFFGSGKHFCKRLNRLVDSKKECICNARFSGVDEAAYAAHGCPACVCNLEKN